MLKCGLSGYYTCMVESSELLVRMMCSCCCCMAAKLLLPAFNPVDLSNSREKDVLKVFFFHFLSGKWRVYLFQRQPRWWICFWKRRRKKWTFSQQKRGRIHIPGIFLFPFQEIRGIERWERHFERQMHSGVQKNKLYISFLFPQSFFFFLLIWRKTRAE